MQNGRQHQGQEYGKNYVPDFELESLVTSAVVIVMMHISPQSSIRQYSTSPPHSENDAWTTPALLRRRDNETIIPEHAGGENR